MAMGGLSLTARPSKRRQKLWMPDDEHAGAAQMDHGRDGWSAIELVSLLKLGADRALR